MRLKPGSGFSSPAVVDFWEFVNKPQPPRSSHNRYSPPAAFFLSILRRGRTWGRLHVSGKVKPRFLHNQPILRTVLNTFLSIAWNAGKLAHFLQHRSSWARGRGSQSIDRDAELYPIQRGVSLRRPQALRSEWRPRDRIVPKNVWGGLIHRPGFEGDGIQ